MMMFYTWTMLLMNDANTNSNFTSKVTFKCRICFNAFLGRSQIRAIRRTIVKTSVCQNGGASLLVIDKNVWPTEKQQAWAHFYCWRLLAISERRHIYFRSYPNGHKWNKFLHLVAKRQMHFVLTVGCTSGGGWGGLPPPIPLSIFLVFS